MHFFYVVILSSSISGCGSPYYHVPRCTYVRQSCQSYPTCDSGTKFCLTNNSCINNYASCSCAGVLECQTSYSNLDAIPTFTVIREFPVVIPAGSETAYEVSGSNLDVKLGYVLGLQVKSNSSPLLCNATNDDWSQPVLWRNTTGWLPRHALVNSSDPWILDSPITCYIRAIYMRKVTVDIPTILTYSQEPETYELEVHLLTSLDSFSKQCRLTAEQPITNLSWIYPALIASDSSAGGILDMEYNLSTSMVVGVSQGSHMQATWNSSMLSIVTDYFGETCPNSIFNISTCDQATVPSLTPFSCIDVQLLETTICQPVLVTVKNNISESDIVVRIKYLLEIRDLQMVPLLDLVEIGVPYNISTLVTCGEYISYQWSLNDSIVGNESAISLTFPTPSIYKILVNASNFLGFETADSSVIAKIRAHLNLLQLNISEIICLINVQQIIEITVLGVGSGAEVTITLHLGNGKQLIETYIMHSTELQQFVALNYSSVGTYTVNVTATDGFDTRSVTRNVQVVNAVSPIILQANVTLISTVESVLFNITLTGQNEGAIIYYWNINGTIIQSDESYILHMFPVHGNYVVNVTASNGVSTATAKIDVTVQEIISDVNLAVVPTGILALNKGSTVSINISATVVLGSDSVFIWSGQPDIIDDGWALYTYSQVGTTSITLTVSNDVSALILTHPIEVQEIIRGVMLSCSECVGDYLASSTNTVLSAAVEEGSHASYVYHMDSESPVSVPNITYQYPTRGTYQILVIASNSISSDNVTVVINVEDAITGLSISSDRLVAALNSTVSFSFIMATGSDLQYVWSFCQSCLEETLAKTAEYIFETEGEHVVSSHVWNHVSSESVNQTVLVLTTLTFVKFTSNLIGNDLAEVGTMYRLAAVTDSNFETNYLWSIGPNNGIRTEFSIQEIVYNFTSFGSYHLILKARNQISNISNDIYLVAEERIVGLQIVCSSTLLATNAIVLIQATVSGGSQIAYDWAIYNSDNVPLNYSSMSLLTWSYNLAGEYTVFLLASNGLGNEAANVIIRIQEPVENIQLESSIMEDFPFVAVSESTWFRGQADGTNLFYFWSFFDQLTNTQYNIIGENVDYIFNAVGQFTVGLSVFNDVSSDAVSRVIYSEEKVADVTLTAPKSIPTNISVAIDIIANKGTHPKYNISFGDGGDETDVTFPTEHIYKRSTIYSIKLIAYNNVSTFNTDTAVTVQDVVMDLHINTNCTQISAANTDISLEADVMQGTDVAFHWEIEHMDSDYFIEKDGKLIHYSFSWPGIYNITVDAVNEVSSQMYSCNKTFQGIISSVEIHTDQDESSLYNGYPIVFTVTGSYVEDVVPIWSVLKDGLALSMPAINADNSLTYIFNSSGVYQVSVVVSNAISSSTVVTTFDIKKLLCNNVSVSIIGTKDRDVLCSRSTEFEVNIDLNGCTDYIVEHHWTVYSMTSCDEPLKNPIVLPDTVFIRSPILNLPARTLTYGKYCIQLSVSLKSLPVIQEGKFLLAVTPSPLRAIIARGSETLYSSLEPVHLDGRGSYDPDVPRETESDFTYQWFCHSPANQVRILFTSRYFLYL